MPNVDVNGTVIEFPDSLSGDQLNQAVSKAASQIQSTPKEPGMWDQLGTGFKRATEIAANTPMGMISQIPSVVNDAAGRLGEKTATTLAEKGYNPSPLFSPGKSIPVSPEVSAGVGTAVSMAPDLISMAATPLQESGEAVNAAKPFARRALGFQKSMLKTPFARGQATKAAGTALENNVIPYSGDPQAMFQNASDLANKSGSQIGKVLDKVPANLNKAFDDLEGVRQQLTNGMKTGIYEKANSAIDSIQQNISEMTSKGPDLTVKALNDVKARLGQSLNYLSDLASQSDNKAIQTGLANTIRELIKAHIAPEEFSAYLENQKLYGAAQLMKKGLNNEIAGQMGNQAVNPMSVMTGAGELAAGNPKAALSVMGATEGLKRRGMGIAARAIQDAGTNAPALTSVAARPAVEGMLKKRILDEKTALQYLDKAGGDREKALQMLQADGY